MPVTNKTFIRALDLEMNMAHWIKINPMAVVENPFFKGHVFWNQIADDRRNAKAGHYLLIPKA